MYALNVYLLNRKGPVLVLSLQLVLSNNQVHLSMGICVKQ